MDRITERMGLENGSIHFITARAHRSKHDDTPPVMGKPSVPSHDSMTDIELIRSMEELYGIREEGLF